MPATLPKDPYTCVKCNTDVSCSWKFDVNCSILCHSCVKCSWRKDHWLSSGPTETIIKSNSDNSSILTSSSNAVWNEPQSLKQAALRLQHSSRSVPQECDQQVFKNSLSSSSNFHPDSPSCLCSPLSSDLSSSPPDYCSDTSSHWSSSISSDNCFSSDSSSSCCLSSCGLCNGSSSSCLPSSSDLSSSSSSMTPSASGSPPKNSSKWVLQKVKTPYWMETPLARALFKDDKGKKKKDKEKEEQLTKSKCKEEKTGKMAALRVPSLSSNQQILPKTQSALPDSEQSSSPLLRVSKHQLQTRMLTPNPRKTTIAEENKLTMEEGLKTGHGNLQKVTPKVSHGHISSTNSGSSTYTSDSGKATVHYLPTSWSDVSGNVRQQDSTAIPRCFDDNKKESIMKNKKFRTKVQHQASHAHPSSSWISSAPTRASFLSQTVLSSNQGKTKPQEKWEAAPNQRIQKPKTSMGSHGSHPSCSLSSSSSSLAKLRK